MDASSVLHATRPTTPKDLRIFLSIWHSSRRTRKRDLHKGNLRAKKKTKAQNAQNMARSMKVIYSYKPFARMISRSFASIAFWKEGISPERSYLSKM